ncbi:solute carrier organic anion transporter family member 5A1-like [Lineus longissimus]|uniref:solute carrier organic anion transporter family member 5A1-like n=1 Tax=Lineus longissimus TaxID=88925 RepID=UPI00315C7006
MAEAVYQSEQGNQEAAVILKVTQQHVKGHRRTASHAGGASSQTTAANTARESHGHRRTASWSPTHTDPKSFPWYNSGFMTYTQDSPDDRKNISTTCGVGDCQPECMQHCAHPVAFLLALCAVTFTQSMLVSGYTSSILTTIERRYNLWSTESGLVISSYEFTCMFAVVFSSYFGSQRNRAHWLAYGSFIVSVGALVFMLPQFTGGNYNLDDVVKNDSNGETKNLCNRSQVKAPNVLEQKLCSIGSQEVGAFSLIIVGQMIIGLGASPVYTLGPTYLYDNVKRTVFSIYIGVFYSISAVGPAMGFLMGALFLSFYVDPGLQPGGFTEQDTGWVGAWWAGFLLCSLLAFISALPLLTFPSQLPRRFSSSQHGACRETVEQRNEDFAMGDLGEGFKELPVRFMKLFKNSTFLGISMVVVMEQSITSGFTAFIAKFFQATYGTPASKANILAGIVIIPGSCIGIMTGGYMMKRLQLPLSGMAKLLIAICSASVVCFGTILFLGCGNIDLAGITASYTKGDTFDVIKYPENLTSRCNEQCVCNQETYQPVCGLNQNTYFNPCYAGCSKVNAYVGTMGHKIRNYSSCSCVSKVVHHQVAVAGACDNGCENFYPFLIMLFLIVLITSLGHNPCLLITLGCVDVEERSFALGMQSFLARAMAFIPAPIYFGYIFDSQCLLWQMACDGSGACLEYNRTWLPFAVFGMALGLKIVSLTFVVLTYFSCRNDGIEDHAAPGTSRGQTGQRSRSMKMCYTNHRRCKVPAADGDIDGSCVLTYHAPGDG